MAPGSKTKPLSAARSHCEAITVNGVSKLKCIHCDAICPDNITRFKEHLTNCDKFKSSADQPDHADQSADRPTKRLKQTDLQSFLDKSRKNAVEEFKKQFLYFAIDTNFEFSKYDNHYFVKAFDTLGVKFEHSTTIGDKGVETVYQEAKSWIDQTIGDAIVVNIRLDGMRDVNSDSKVNVVVKTLCPTTSIAFKSICPGEDRQNNLFYKSVFKKLIDDIGKSDKFSRLWLQVAVHIVNNMNSRMTLMI